MEIGKRIPLNNLKLGEVMDKVLVLLKFIFHGTFIVLYPPLDEKNQWPKP